MKEDYNLATPLLRFMQDISKEVNQINKERKRKDLGRRFEEEGLSTSYQQKIRPKNHRSTMSTFFEEGERYRNEEKRESKTHETLSLYLEEYKA